MEERNNMVIFWGLGVLFLGVLIFGTYLLLITSHDEDFHVSFLDVGQGDGILLSEGSLQILIDGGRSEALLRERLADFLPWGDRNIEIILPTHPDADHIGALSEIARIYDVDLVMETDAENDTGVYRSWKSIQEKRLISRDVVRRGDRIIFPGGTVAEVLYPFDGRENKEKDTNASSVVVRLDVGENSFLFTGDLPEEKEKFLDTQDIDVLKVSHHGSKSSTSNAFLDMIHPRDAIISVGNNAYGHPNDEVIEKLRRRDIRILRTDDLGTITYKCKEKQTCEITKEKEF